MAQVQFMMTDEGTGPAASIACEARSSDVNDKASMSNIVAAYIADNWPGLVMSARMAHQQAILREGQSLMQEDELAKAPGLVDSRGLELPSMTPLGVDKLN